MIHCDCTENQSKCWGSYDCSCSLYVYLEERVVFLFWLSFHYDIYQLQNHTWNSSNIKYGMKLKISLFWCPIRSIENGKNVFSLESAGEYVDPAHHNHEKDDGEDAVFERNCDSLNHAYRSLQLTNARYCWAHKMFDYRLFPNRLQRRGGFFLSFVDESPLQLLHLQVLLFLPRGTTTHSIALCLLVD